MWLAKRKSKEIPWQITWGQARPPVDEKDHAKMESSWGLNLPSPCSLRWVAIIDIMEARMASLVIDLF
jgi:hypothetical protein